MTAPLTDVDTTDDIDIDEAAVLRAMDGDKSFPLNSDEVRAVVGRLAAKGLRNADIGERLGVSDSLVQSWRAGTRSWPLSLAAHRGSTTTGHSGSATRPVPAPPTPAPPVAEPTLDALISAAARSSSKRTQALGAKLGELAGVVRQRLRDERDVAEARAREAEVREKATAEVAELEKKLAAARAKLRGRGGSGTVSRPSAKPATGVAAVQHHCAKGCGKGFRDRRGIARHEKACGGAS